MERLKRKRPASEKKKGRKKAAKKSAGQQVVDKSTISAGGAVKKEVAPKPAAVASKEISSKAAKPTGRKTQLSIYSKTTQFLREVRVELRKVSWPSKKETVASTVVVIILVMIVSVFLGVVDMGLSSLIRLVLH